MNIYPKLSDIENLKSSTHIPVVCQFTCDSETPITIYQKLSQQMPYSFLLESGEHGSRLGRYSFIGFQPKKIFEFKNGVCSITEKGNICFKDFDQPLEILENELKKYETNKDFFQHCELPILSGGLIGFFSYECSRYFDEIPLAMKDPLEIADGIFGLYEMIVVFDHFKSKISFIKHLDCQKDLRSEYEKALSTFDILRQALNQNEHNLSDLQFTEEILLEKEFGSNFEEEEFCKRVEEILEMIRSGETYQLQLSQRLKLKLKEKDGSFDIYRRLRIINPSPYMYFLKYPNFDIVGASPETLVRVENGDILVRPIAGTRKRTGNDQRDRELEEELRTDPKEQAEHLMLVDLARNDLGRVAEIQSVRTEELMHFERFSHVVHLVSDVRGKLKKDKTIFDAFKAIFPHGTVTGAPKLRSQEIIAKMENERRGIYCGAVGYFDFHGNMDMAIAIRTILVKDRFAYTQAAGGIVFDSKPEFEFKESLNKMKGSLAAIL